MQRSLNILNVKKLFHFEILVSNVVRCIFDEIKISFAFAILILSRLRIGSLLRLRLKFCFLMFLVKPKLCDWINNCAFSHLASGRNILLTFANSLKITQFSKVGYVT